MTIAVRSVSKTYWRGRQSITALQNVFAIPLDYVRETLSSPTTLKVFLPFVDDASFLGRLTSRAEELINETGDDAAGQAALRDYLAVVRAAR